MKVTKAVITAAGRSQRALPLQTVVDRDGTPKSVLRVLVEEAVQAGVEDICVVVCPGDEGTYAEAVGDRAGHLVFVPQAEARGYGHAIHCAREFVGGRPFLHLVGDHLWVGQGAKGCAQQLVEVAEAEACAVSAVQASRETLLRYHGAIGGRRVPGRQDLYLIEDVIEKPTPTEAEQRLLVPGLRSGHYLCFFGMHVLTPVVMDLLGQLLAEQPDESAATKDQRSSARLGGFENGTALGGALFSRALATLAARERYLALERPWWRYDVGVKYGLLVAQLALALSGKERDQVLTQLLELLANRELNR